MSEGVSSDPKSIGDPGSDGMSMYCDGRVTSQEKAVSKDGILISCGLCSRLSENCYGNMLHVGLLMCTESVRLDKKRNKVHERMGHVT